MEFDINRAAEEFRKLHPEYADPEEAFDSCWDASLEFQEMVVEMGLVDGDKQFDDWDLVGVQACPGVYHIPENMRHWVFRVGNTLIDWTARQFNPDAPFPCVWVSSDYTDQAEWGGV